MQVLVRPSSTASLHRLLARCAIAAALSTALPTASLAQQHAMPTLDQLLTGVENNTTAYVDSVPSLVADEHVVSTVSIGMTSPHGTATDSIFRLRRSTAPNGETELTESRESKATAAGTEQQVAGPTIAVGLFRSGTMDFSPGLKHCYDYQLQSKTQQLRHTTVVVVDYTLKPQLPPNSDCPVTEPVSGEAFIDLTTMQVMRVKQKLPQHELVPGKIGLWSWSIDYEQVDLGGKTFWLPQSISSDSTLPGNRSNGPQQVWSFVATYRNYHLLEVRTKILPATEAPGSR